MEVVNGFQQLVRKYPNPVVSLGNFDGVHLGHQEILLRVKERAKELEGTALVYTFHPHPLSVLTQQKQFLNITTLDEKLQVIEQAGMDVVVCEPFTPDFSRITAENFVKNILFGRIGVKEIFVGEDYSFGSKRQGNIYFLQKMGKSYDYRVKIVEDQSIDNIIVKSSKIREFIQMGEVEVAGRLLGRNYRLKGEVVKGVGRGVKLGFPTANVKPNKVLQPGVGVYAVWVKVAGEVLPGAMNIGYNPTFEGKELSLEVHILDFNRDIYGKELEIDFVKRIRKEKAFSSGEELVTQLRQDVSAVKKILAC